MKARSRQFIFQFLVVFLVFLAVVEEAEKKQCWKCRGPVVLEMLRVEMLLEMDI